MSQTLTIAVCICNGVTLTDFIPPMEILSSVNMADVPGIYPAELLKDVKYRFTIHYIAPTKEPIQAMSPMQITVNPTHTYSEALSEGPQYDIIWIPAGPIPMDPTAPLASVIPPEQISFIAKQAPRAKYVMSVCGGSIQLAVAGLLDGKRATTNKAFYKAIVSQTSDKIKWVAKARWVVDGNIWTSSGVSAGADMALAFLEHLISKEFSEIVRSRVEVHGSSSSEDDPFAAIHGLI